MIIFFPIIVGIALGWLRGGRLRNLAALPIRQTWLPGLAFVIQAGFVIYSGRDGSAEGLLRAGMLMVTYGALLGFLLLHRRIPGAMFLLAGASLNSIVMFANGGFMPVTREALARSGHEGQIVARGGQLFVAGSKDVVLGGEETRLKFLSDVLGIPESSPFSANFSVGDVLIGIGAVVLLSQAMRGGSRPPRQGIPNRAAPQPS